MNPNSKDSIVLKPRKPVPLFYRGPDPLRFYARDIKRWEVSGGSGKDEIKAQVVLRRGWGCRETLGVLAVPIVGILLFGAMCLTIQYFDAQNRSMGRFFLIVVGICVLQIPFFATLTWLAVSYFDRFSPDVLKIFHNGEFSIDGDKARHELTLGSILRYTHHYAEPGSESGSSYSELDLVVRDGNREIAVHKIMAYQYPWCWKPAKKLSELSGIPLKRVALQSSGKPFPPAIPG